MLFSDDSRFVSFAITQRKPRVRVIVPESERRRSGRERVAINYAEKYGLDDEEDAAAARQSSLHAPAASGRKKPKLAQLTDGDFARRRFSVGARVYDSELGVTCHWCRQKTVETHVFCTAEACQGQTHSPSRFAGCASGTGTARTSTRRLRAGFGIAPGAAARAASGASPAATAGPVARRTASRRRTR